MRYMRLLILLLLSTPAWAATTYYMSTAGTATPTNCAAATTCASQNCTQAFDTFAEAMSCLQAGDTLRVRGGVYNQRLTITKNGNATQGYITIEAFPDETPIIEGGAVANGTTVLGTCNGTGFVNQGSEAQIGGTHTKYVKVKGFTLRNGRDAGLVLRGELRFLEVRDNTIVDKCTTATNGVESNSMLFLSRSTGGPAPGATGTNVFDSHDLIVDGNTIQNVRTGIQSVIQEALTVSLSWYNVQITNNLLENVDCIGIDLIGYTQERTDRIYNNTLPIPPEPWPKYVRISGNTVRNSGGCSSGDSGIYLDGARDVVIENNTLINNTPYGLVVSAEEEAFDPVGNPTRHFPNRVLVRRNVFHNNTINMGIGTIGATNGVVTTGEIRVAHNTGVYTTGTGRTMVRPFSNHPVFRNNIFRHRVGGGTQLNHGHTGSGATLRVYSPATPALNYNVWFPSTQLQFIYKDVTYLSFSAYQTGTAAAGYAQDVNSITTAPTFLNETTSDFRLSTGSAGINAGAPLTTTTSTGSGTQIPVADAYWFTNGYGLWAGDTIRVGADTVTVTGISYGTVPAGTLTVTPSISWTNGEGVTYVFNGAAPDMGAFETGAVTAPSVTACVVQDNARSTALITMTNPSTSPMGPSTGVTGFSVTGFTPGNATRVTGSTTQFTLPLGRDAVFGEAIPLSYDPSTGNLAANDGAGVELASVSDFPCVNNVAAPPAAPRLLSGVATAATTLTLTFDAAGASPMLPSTGCTLGGGCLLNGSTAWTVSSCTRGANDQMILTMSSSADSDDVITCSSGTTNITNSTPTAIEAFTGTAITNTIPPPAPSDNAVAVARYLCNDTPNDSVGTHHGTWTGGGGYIASQAGYSNACTFDNVDDYLSIAHAGELNPTSSTGMTLTAWVYLTDLDTTTNSGHMVVSKGNWNTTNSYSLVFYQNNLRCSIGQIWNSGVTYASSNFTTNTWYHVACVATPLTHVLYVNGTAVASKSLTINPVTNSSPLRLGILSVSGTASRFAGRMDNVGIYTGVLTQSEITGLATVPETPPGTCTVAQTHWRFSHADQPQFTEDYDADTGLLDGREDGPILIPANGRVQFRGQMNVSAGNCPLNDYALAACDNNTGGCNDITDFYALTDDSCTTNLACLGEDSGVVPNQPTSRKLTSCTFGGGGYRRRTDIPYLPVALANATCGEWVTTLRIAPTAVAGNTVRLCYLRSGQFPSACTPGLVTVTTGLALGGH